MPAPKVAPPVQDLSALAPPFRALAERLVGVVGALPLRVEETRRPLARHAYFYRRGVERLPLVALCYGLGMDVTLDPRHDWWGTADARPQKAIDGRDPRWDTGYSIHPAQQSRVVLARPNVAQVWSAFGAAAESLGLSWGGNAEQEPSPFDGHALGRRPWRVTLRGWRSVAGKMPQPSQT